MSEVFQDEFESVPLNVDCKREGAKIHFEIKKNMFEDLHNTCLEEFIRSLLKIGLTAMMTYRIALIFSNLDPRWRLSLSSAVVHPFLTYGQYLDEQGIEDMKSDDAILVMNPRCLYQSLVPIVALPMPSSYSSSSSENDDSLWKRRQFSVLWAPMPSNSTEADESAVEIQNTSVDNGDKVWNSKIFA
jgi:hypothetical protein